MVLKEQSSHAKLICVEIGGTYIRYARVSNLGEIESIDSDYIFESKENEIELQEKIFLRIQSEINSVVNVRAIIFAVPWIVDTQSPYKAKCATNFSEDFSLEKIFYMLKKYNIPVFFINDVNAATIGEQWKGELEGIQNGLYINIGTGLSMGIIIDNNLYNGTNGMAGEIGFCLNSPDDLSDNTISIEPFLENIVSGRKFQEYIRENEKEKKLQEAICILSMHIINISYIFNPQRIVFGGGVIRHSATFFNEIQKKIISHMPNSLCPEIRQSKIAHNGVIGATKYSINKLRGE